MQRRFGFVIATVVAIGVSPARADEIVTTSFDSTGTFSWPVPIGVTSVSITAIGARGGDGIGPEGAKPGHPGKRVATGVAIPPGTGALTVRVGTGAAGGVGGGPDDTAGGRGGNATEISAGGTRLVVAGGGGGGGGGCVFRYPFSIDDCASPAGSGPDGASPAPQGVAGGGGLDIITNAGGGGGGGGGGLLGGEGGDGGSAFAFPLPVPGLLDLVSHPGGDGGAGTSFPAAGVDTDEAPRVVISFVRGSTVLVYTGATAGDYHDPATVSARLTGGGGTPVAGAPVVFTLNSAETCTAITDATGIAACTIIPEEPAGSYPLVVSYAGDAVRLPSTLTVTFTVTEQETVLVYTGDTRVANAEPARLAAVLSEETAAPIAGREVTLVLGEGSAAQSCTATTGAGGEAACTIDAVAQPLNAAATVAVSASFAGDGFYLASAADATAELQYMTGTAYAIAGTTRVLGLAVTIARTPDTGAIRTANASSTTTPCTSWIGPLGARTLCANVTTSVASGGTVSTASIENARIALGGLLPVIELDAIAVHADAGCDGASAGTTIGALRIGGQPITITAGQTSTISLPLGGKVIVNEQRAVAGADEGVTVNGVHVTVPALLGLAAVDLVFASATAAIHQCRPPSAERRAPDRGDEPEDDDEALVDGGCSAGGGGASLLVGLLALRRRRRR